MFKEGLIKYKVIILNDLVNFIYVDINNYMKMLHNLLKILGKLLTKAPSPNFNNILRF